MLHTNIGAGRQSHSRRRTMFRPRLTLTLREWPTEVYPSATRLCRAFGASMPKILPIMMGLVRLTALVFVALVCTALVYGMFYYAKPRHFGFFSTIWGSKKQGYRSFSPMHCVPC